MTIFVRSLLCEEDGEAIPNPDVAFPALDTCHLLH